MEKSLKQKILRIRGRERNAIAFTVKILAVTTHAPMDVFTVMPTVLLHWLKPTD
jgi:hypothetical protein